MLFDELIEKVAKNIAYEIRFYGGYYYLFYGTKWWVDGKNKEEFARAALDYMARIELGHELDMRMRRALADDALEDKIDEIELSEQDNSLMGRIGRIFDNYCN